MAFNKARALQEAERSLAQGRVSEAAQQYLNIVENDPSDLAVINLAGDLCVRARNIPEALRLFRKLAESYVNEGFVPRAIAIYKKILKLEPSNVDFMLRLAGLYSGQGLIREARDLYAQALSICQERQLQDKALEVMRRIAADEPANIAHRLRLAELYKAAGQTEEAFKTYLEAAETAWSGSNPEIASVSLEQAAALRPDDRRLVELREGHSAHAPAQEVPATAMEPESAAGIAFPLEHGPEPVSAAGASEEADAFEQPEAAASAGPSEIDLSDDWETAAAGQSAPGAAGFDLDDLELEIDFYLNYGMAQKALERLEQLEREFPGDAQLAKLRKRCAGGGPAGPARAGTEGPSKGAAHGTFAAPGGQPDFAASLETLLNDLGSEASPLPRESDPQTHYELGIAFREMGMVDDAVGELQKAVRGARPATDRKRFLSACSLLALCFVEKQMPALAAKWYTRALEVPGLDPDAILALQYDLGVAYELAGNPEAARQNFLEVYGQNVEYRDVAAKIRQPAASR